VVYGTDLDKITGSVKLSVVGYGRKTQEGSDTMGGRSATDKTVNSFGGTVFVYPIACTCAGSYFSTVFVNSHIMTSNNNGDFDI
jgi:hypothetical protein